MKVTKVRIFALVGALILVGVLAAYATGLTGAYYSDTASGAVAGTIGDIHITCAGVNNGSNGLNFTWNEILPGVVYQAAVDITSTSHSDLEDLYLYFPNRTALSALNTLGTYGAVTIDVNGNPVFQSNNLNDIPNNGCNPLPYQVLLASNVAPASVTHLIVKFEYASALVTQPAAGQGGVIPFNQYPITLAMSGHSQDSRYPAGFAQYTVNGSDGASSGLPFQIVATEPGILPFATGTTAPIIQ